MPKINLKNIIATPQSTVGSIAGSISDGIGNATNGAFDVSIGQDGVSASVNFQKLLQKKVTGNKVVSPLKDLYKKDSKVYRPIIFPDTLGDEHYIIFNVMERKRPSLHRAPSVRPIRSIVLPIPSNLTVQYGVNYESEGIGIFGAGVSGRLNLPGWENDLSSAVMNKASQLKKDFMSGDTDAITAVASAAAPFIAGYLGGSVAGPLGALVGLGGTAGGVLSGLSLDFGVAVNPHYATMFKGVGFRRHEFAYKFVARNQRESDKIKEIIAVLKYHMHPAFVAGNLAFEYPDEFNIEFAEAVQPYLYRIGTCVMDNFKVNYNGENMPVFFETTGAPVSIEIAMSFQETRIMTRDDPDVDNIDSQVSELLGE